MVAYKANCISLLHTTHSKECVKILEVCAERRRQLTVNQ